MKKYTLMITTLSLLLALILSACSSTPEQEVQAGAVDTDSANSVTLDDSYENAMPVSTQLMLGTLKLEGTELAVDPSQAADLLVLWKAARSLNESETVAAEEMDAIFKQIQEAMSAEQIKAIAGMQLTRQDMTQTAQDMGVEFGFGTGGFGDMSPEMQATAQAARESGQGFRGGGQGFPGGGPGGGGPGGGGFGEQVSPEQQATMEARRAERGGNAGARFTLMLADPLIELLEARAQE